MGGDSNWILPKMKNLSEATEGSFKCDIIDNLIRNSDPGI